MHVSAVSPANLGPALAPPNQRDQALAGRAQPSSPASERVPAAERSTPLLPQMAPSSDGTFRNGTFLITAVEARSARLANVRRAHLSNASALAAVLRLRIARRVVDDEQRSRRHLHALQANHGAGARRRWRSERDRRTLVRARSRRASRNCEKKIESSVLDKRPAP